MAASIFQVRVSSTTGPCTKSEKSDASVSIRSSAFQLVAEEQLLSLKRQKAASRWATIFIPILVVIFAVLIWWGEGRISDGDFDSWNDMILVLSYITLTVTSVFILAIIVVWNESEIRAVQHDFTIFFFFFATMNSVAHIVFALAPGSPAPNGAFIDNLGFAAFIVLLCFSMQCTLIGSLVLRQRLYYLIYRCYDLQPNFWKAVPVFALVCGSIATPLIVCGYYAEECGAYVAQSMHFVQMVVMSGAYGYYLYYTYQGSSVFVQFWQNLRACVLHTFTQLVFFGLYLAKYSTLHAEMIMATFFVWLIMLDTFSVPLVRAVARRIFGVLLWHDLDFTGLPLRALSNQASLESCLRDEQMSAALEAFANSRFAGENIRFLKRIDMLYSKYLNKQDITDETAKAVDDFLRSTSRDNLNIMCSVRRQAISNYERGAPVTEIFGTVEKEIKTLIAIQLWKAFTETPEYKAIAAEQDRLVAIETNVQNGLCSIGVVPASPLPIDDSTADGLSDRVVVTTVADVSSATTLTKTKEDRFLRV